MPLNSPLKTMNFAVLFLAGLSTGCDRSSAATSGQPVGGQPGSDLIFESGFEGDSGINRPTPFAAGRFAGGNPTPDGAFPWGMGFAHFMGTNIGGSHSGETVANIVADPTRPGNHVLELTLNDAVPEGSEVKARSQLDIGSIKPGLRDFSISVRAYFGPGFGVLADYPKKVDWLTIAEFWNNEFWGPLARYGFRISVATGKSSAAPHPLNFFVTAGLADSTPAWTRDDPNAVVPIGKWMTIDYYFHEGDSATGRFVMGVTPDGGTRKVIYDVTDYTQHPLDPAPDGVTSFSPAKVYTSSQVMTYLHAHGANLTTYWDDLKIYNGHHAF